MLGAIIGDLAAWTWEHDRECFYTQLVSPEAKLSGYGLLALIMWKPIVDGDAIAKTRLYVQIGKALMHCPPCAEIPQEWRTWSSSEYDRAIPFDLKLAMFTAATVDSGFCNEERQKHLNWVSFFHCGKAEMYASDIMTVLRRLYEGDPKDEAIQNLPPYLHDWYKSGENNWDNILAYSTFAWRCFYYAFDFTSAIHNAMKCDHNRHLAAFLTGAYASAMYGCRFSMTKKKYGGNYEYINLIFLDKYFDGIIKDIQRREYRDRFFFPKNDALTNVELQHWTNIENPFADYNINSELRRRMLRAFGTSWEHRFGLYLDNGWIYVYRSHELIFRFQLKKVSSDSWRIINLQKSDFHYTDIEILKHLIQELESCWYDLGPWSFPLSCEEPHKYLKYCKYYHGETQCPISFSKKKSDFWFGEKMFLETDQDLEEWKKMGEETRENLPVEKKEIAKKYNPETFGIILYIETLFQKWRPMESTEWIFDY